MPVYVHVKHYLTSEGIEYFDDWFKKVYSFMSKSPGFISLTSEKIPKENTMHIVVCFKSEEQLDTWVKHPVHDELVDELDPYRSKDFWEAARTQKKMANWETMDYEPIQVTSLTSTSDSED